MLRWEDLEAALALGGSLTPRGNVQIKLRVTFPHPQLTRLILFCREKADSIKEMSTAQWQQVRTYVLLGIWMDPDRLLDPDPGFSIRIF